jgi:CPA1 family monovalent cation:H+ antiporter
VGLALGWGANKLLDALGDATLQIGLTLLVPYVSYVLAEELHGSGVLAVLTTAMFLAEYAVGADDVMTRLAGHTVWDVVDTLVTGVAFGLIGLELHNAIRTASGRWAELLGWAGAVVGVVILVRLAWLLPATWLTQRLHARRDHDEDIPTSWRETVVMWWSGMRGVASVALALAIPLKTDDGSPFPNREEIVFIAFGVIMVTLLLQGLTLPWLVNRLGVRSDTEREKDYEKALAVRAAKAAKQRLKEIEAVEELPEELSEQMLRRAFDIGIRISPDIGDEERREAQLQRARRLKRIRRIQGEMLSAARHEVLAARSEPGADPEIVDRVLRHLDVRSLR